MDKKELQNLIDRISLTGPEGIKKIKKVIKEISDGDSLGFMGEDEEYTIAQALNDLNERIAALENASAQQSETHILEIIGQTSPNELDIDVALSKLLYDGHEPTLDELLEADFRSVIIRYEDYDLLPVCVRKNEDITIVVGQLYEQHEEGVKAVINLTTSPSASANIYQVVSVYGF